MKLASTVLSFITFNLLFFVIVLPVGWLLRVTLDPHRLGRKPTDSFFNMAPHSAGYTAAPGDASLSVSPRPNTGV